MVISRVNGEENNRNAIAIMMMKKKNIIKTTGNKTKRTKNMQGTPHSPRGCCVVVNDAGIADVIVSSTARSTGKKVSKAVSMMEHKYPR